MKQMSQAQMESKFRQLVAGGYTGSREAAFRSMQMKAGPVDVMGKIRTVGSKAVKAVVKTANKVGQKISPYLGSHTITVTNKRY